MSKPTPSVQAYMAASPHTIDSGEVLAKARATMTKLRIRHLPVLAGGELVGILTERDLALIGALKGVDPSFVRVAEAMSPSVYAVAPSTPLDEVVEKMAEHKYGCAVVVEDGAVVGILTTVDVCRAFADVLKAGR